MDSSAPPAYSEPNTSTTDNNLEAPPPFEPGQASPVAAIDSKPPIDEDGSQSSLPDLPKRARPAEQSISRLPPPPTLSMNNKSVGPFDLVTVDEIKAHLVLLGAFARLKAEVKSQKSADVRGSTDELWATYIARAVDRFAKWAEKGLPDDIDVRAPRQLVENEIPPLDVLMAWHTYMLNPRVYFEDGLHRKSDLLRVSTFPLSLVKTLIDVDTLAAIQPSYVRQQRFESLTGQPWFCPLNTTPSDTTFVPCPRCPSKTMNEVSWVTDEKTGFAQHGFRAQCHACTRVFDRDAMMVRGFCDDAVQVRLALTLKPLVLDNHPFICGTLLNWSTGQPDREDAVRTNKVLLKHFLTSNSMGLERGDHLAESLDYSVDKLEIALQEGLILRGKGPQVTRILGFYRSSNYPFSIELAGAILRQGSFIDKMTNLGWTEPHTFDDDPTTLVRCIARYNAWLEIMSQLTRRMLVPTLDIDLAWHTHQLKQLFYRTSTTVLIGQFVDHDDKVEENKLSDGFEQTAKYWELRWGVPYHICGCPQPPPAKTATPGDRLSKIFRGKGKAKAPAEFANPRPQLISTQDCDSSLTHPSEHNSILIVGQPLSESRRVGREQEYTRWEKHVRTNIDKGKVPPEGWEAMNLQRSQGHGVGFMRPVPDPNLTPVTPYGAETCAAHDGRAIQGQSLSTSPTDGKHTAGVCAAGMGHYGIWPLGGFSIGPTGGCASVANCGGGKASCSRLAGGCGGGLTWL